jgi:hypothetical protein
MNEDKIKSELITFLTSINANNVRHSGRTLMEHLIGTYEILRSWGCDDSICIAGGLHSIFGTNKFLFSCLSVGDRPNVRSLFGENAEELIWLFCTLNRPKAIENGVGINRINGETINIEQKKLHSLRLIEAANLLEQSSSLARWPIIHQTAIQAQGNIDN